MFISFRYPIIYVYSFIPQGRELSNFVKDTMVLIILSKGLFAFFSKRFFFREINKNASREKRDWKHKLFGYIPPSFFLMSKTFWANPLWRKFELVDALSCDCLHLTLIFPVNDIYRCYASIYPFLTFWDSFQHNCRSCRYFRSFGLCQSFSLCQSVSTHTHKCGANLLPKREKPEEEFKASQYDIT